MGSWFSSNKFSKEEQNQSLNEAKKIISSNPVVVFSKTYCGYCSRVKELLTQLGASHKVIELDQKSDGDAIQSALAEWTGQTSVPNVFIGGKHIGGCDAVTNKHSSGQLMPLLAAAGAIANDSAQL
ncbi:glutaredoxin [Cucurbita pepo subsp. pepo]|uniref:glutaredoxin n=1 Tax=Cucurbita pepo subsp. pepo TaxID=3664 RepID=UPI000C9D5451|nr:glutaredoxin [Cucurbita pepo subsp. pepo]